MTPGGNWRNSIVRFYWTTRPRPRSKLPWAISSRAAGQVLPDQLAGRVREPGSAFNCYWPMPFRKKARVTMENLDDKT